MPYLYPSSIHEMIEMGQLGIAMSRYSGCWVGMKVITFETVETTAEIDLADELKPFIIPADFEMPPGGRNLRWPDDRYDYEDRRACRTTRALPRSPLPAPTRSTASPWTRRMPVSASWRPARATRTSARPCASFGVTPEVAAKIRASALARSACPGPLEPQGVREFAVGLEEIFIVEASAARSSRIK